MEVFLIKALQLILCFSILIILHEGGHFFFARLFKIRVEKFALFFDPWFRLAKFKPKSSDTTYVLGWLPLGGYVKISGMVDESMDMKQLEAPAQPWEFRAKPAWQRLLVMIGGVLVNFLLALFIYSMVLFTWGDEYVPMRNMTHGFKYNAAAQHYGFRDGDIPLRTENKVFDRFEGSIYRDLSTAKSVTVLRGNQEVTIALPGDLNMLEMVKEEPRFLSPLLPAQIDTVIPNGNAAKAGLHKGDKLTTVNGQAVTTANEFSVLVANMKKAAGKDAVPDKNQPLTVVVQRAQTLQTDTLRLALDDQWKAGIGWATPAYQTKTIQYGFFESFPAGIRHGVKVLQGYVSDLRYLFTRDGAESVGSFGAIGNLFPATWDWMRFWELTAFISIMLAFMNILPIPALDGGHVLFLLYEVITGRKPSDKFLSRAETVGMILLLTLMAFAIFNDLRNFVF